MTDLLIDNIQDNYKTNQISLCIVAQQLFRWRRAYCWSLVDNIFEKIIILEISFEQTKISYCRQKKCLSDPIWFKLNLN